MSKKHRICPVMIHSGIDGSEVMAIEIIPPDETGTETIVYNGEAISNDPKIVAAVKDVLIQMLTQMQALDEENDKLKGVGPLHH